MPNRIQSHLMTFISW